MYYELKDELRRQTNRYLYTFSKELSQKQESKYDSGNEKVLNIIMFHLLCVSDDMYISLFKKQFVLLTLSSDSKMSSKLRALNEKT